MITGQQSAQSCSAAPGVQGLFARGCFARGSPRLRIKRSFAEADRCYLPACACFVYSKSPASCRGRNRPWHCSDLCSTTASPAKYSPPDVLTPSVSRSRGNRQLIRWSTNMPRPARPGAEAKLPSGDRRATRQTARTLGRQAAPPALAVAMRISQQNAHPMTAPMRVSVQRGNGHSEKSRKASKRLTKQPCHPAEHGLYRHQQTIQIRPAEKSAQPRAPVITVRRSPGPALR